MPAIVKPMPTTKMCGNYWHDLFRDYHGNMTFYCGYYLHPVLFDADACIAWKFEKPSR